MPISRPDYIIVDNETVEDLRVYINTKGAIVFNNDREVGEYDSVFFTLTKEEWDEVKVFVDAKFNELAEEENNQH